LPKIKNINTFIAAIYNSNSDQNDKFIGNNKNLKDGRPSN